MLHPPFSHGSARVHAACAGLFVAAAVGLVASEARATPSFKTVTGWKQFSAAKVGDVAEEWESPLEGAAQTNLLDIAYLGMAPNPNSCNEAAAPPADFMSGACWGQCVELTDRWFVKYVYKKLAEKKSKIWGNGGAPICKCAAGQNACATDAALYSVHWPGDGYVPMTGDVLSFSFTHAALVTNVWKNASGTHLGVVQQNVASVNVVPWKGGQFASESCIIHAKGLVCGDEAPLPSPPPAGAGDALVFACGDQRRTTVTGDWSPGRYTAECAEGEAMTGLSVRPQFQSARAALCGTHDDSLMHSADACRALDFSQQNVEPPNAVDWDAGFYKGLCDDDEYAAGISQTSDSRIHSILCCKGQALAHQDCATLVFSAANAREPGTSGDWDSGRFKGECGPGRFVAGVSATADGTSKLHAIRCCVGILPPPPLLDAGPPGDDAGPSQSTSSSSGAGGGGGGGGAPGAPQGSGGGSGDALDGDPAGCACRAVPSSSSTELPAVFAAALLGLAMQRRKLTPSRRRPS